MSCWFLVQTHRVLVGSYLCAINVLCSVLAQNQYALQSRDELNETGNIPMLTKTRKTRSAYADVSVYCGQHNGRLL